MSKTVTITRQSNGGVLITVNGGVPRGIDDTVNTIIKPIDNFTGCIVKSPGNEWQIRLYLVDAITINGSPAPTVLADLITVLLNWVFAGTQAYATPTKLAQTITFAAPAGRAHTAPAFALVATSTSGLPVTFTSSDPTKFTCTGTNGATCTPVAAGTANLLGDQAGNTFYSAATEVVNPLTLT